MFFSKNNIKKIQKKIRKEIFSRTNGKYKLNVDQDKDSLIVAMISVYKRFNKGLPCKIVRQTKKLNNHLVDFIVPGMITEIKQYYGYMKDINQPIKPIMRPLNMSSAGTKMGQSIGTNLGFR